MPRQNFLSRESFVDCSEKQTRDSILSIPAFAPNIRFVCENKMIESFRFAYEMPGKALQFYIDVTIQPLNNKFTRVSMHGTHLNGKAFNHKKMEMAIALHDFEAAMLAAVKDEVSTYQPYQPKEKQSRKFFEMAAQAVAAVGVVLMKKKLS